MANNEKDVNKKNSHYFKDMKAELKKVVWPSTKQTANNTAAVIVFALFIAIVVFILDSVFNAVYKYGVTPLQEKITSSYSQDAENTTNNEEQSSSEEDVSENEEIVVNATTENDNSSTAENTSTEEVNENNENAETETESQE